MKFDYSLVFSFLVNNLEINLPHGKKDSNKHGNRLGCFRKNRLGVRNLSGEEVVQEAETVRAGQEHMARLCASRIPREGIETPLPRNPI